MPTVSEVKAMFEAQTAPLATEFRMNPVGMTQRQYTIAVAVWYSLGALVGLLFGPVWAIAILPLVVLAQIAKFIGENKRAKTPEITPNRRRN